MMGYHRSIEGVERNKTVLNFTKNSEGGKQQGAAPIMSGNEAVKQNTLQAQLSEYENIAIPWSFEAITQDSRGKTIRVSNTCAHDTVFMALYWLREYDATFGPVIRAEGELLNVVLDNIKQ
jgi:hypothetical protein